MGNDALLPIKTILSTTAARWLSLTETLPVDLLTRPPAPNEWSAFQCLGHLYDTERWVFPVRVRAFLAGQDMAAFDPDTQGTNVAAWSPVQLATEFAKLRAASLAELEHVTLQDFERTSQHGELGLVTLGEMLHEWAAHDLMHTIQAERALMQPFIVASGPWRFYFADHDVSK